MEAPEVSGKQTIKKNESSSLQLSPSQGERTGSRRDMKNISFSKTDFLAYRYYLKQTEARVWIESTLSREIPTDLSEALNSGVILCQLYNFFFNGAILKIYDSDHSSYAFKKLQNIQFFTNAITNRGIIAEEDCFQATDLYDKKNMCKVVWTLRKFADYIEENRTISMRWKFAPQWPNIEVVDEPKNFQEIRKLPRITEWAHFLLDKKDLRPTTPLSPPPSPARLIALDNIPAASPKKILSPPNTRKNSHLEKLQEARKAEVEMARKATAEEESRRRSLEKEKELRAAPLTRGTSQILDAKKESQIKTLVNKIDEMLALQEKEEHEGLTALHIAAEDGHEAVVSFLINQGRDINARTVSGETPLSKAVDMEQEKVVNKLIEGGSDVNLPNTDLQLPVHRATLRGNKKLVEALLAAGAKVDSLDRDKNSSLHLAARENFLHLVDLFIERGAKLDNKNDTGATPLHLASVHGNTNIVKTLVTAGCDVNAQNEHNETPLQLAAAKNHLDTVKTLVTLGADVNTRNHDGWSPLYTAAWQGGVEAVNYLLEKGADVNAQNEEGWSPLHVAASEGHLEVVQLMVEKFKADINIQNDAGTTPLFQAVSVGHYSIVHYLLGKGADVNRGADWLPIHAAVYGESLNLTKLLLQYGADINARNQLVSNYTPLLITLAIQDPPQDLVQFLVLNGADLTLRDNSGENALHLSAFWGHYDLIEYFLSRGIPLSVTNYSGQTALDLAVAAGHHEVAELLARKSGKKVPSHLPSDKTNVTIFTKPEKPPLPDEGQEFATSKIKIAEEE